MKRRGFLSLLGAVMAAPALPSAATSLPVRLSQLAATHARTYPCVSAVGLSRGLGVPMAQAQVLLRDLSSKGLVGPISHAGTGPIYAASAVYRPAASAVLKVAQLRPSMPQTHAVANDWLAYVQDICVRNGFALQPRAVEMAR